MRFCDLMNIGRSLLPSEGQKLRDESFELEFSSISQSKMQLWKVNQTIPKKGKRFLLGVYPSWNFYDLYLLDCINNALETQNNAEVFEVFNLDTLPNLPELQTIFGNISPKQPPILGIWEDGILSKNLWGWEAKTFLIEKYKFIWSPLEEDYIKSRDAKIAKILNR